MTLKIHVGAHKTATTALQDAFASKSADLRALGVSYIGPGGPGHGYGSLSSALSGHSREALRETVRIIRQNMVGDDLMVISDENILGVLKHAGPKAADIYPNYLRRLERLVRAFETDDPEILISIRSPADFFTSVVSQRVSNGTLDPRTVCYSGDDILNFRWSDLLASICECRPGASVTVWRYEDLCTAPTSIISAAFGEVVGSVLDFPSARVNAGLSQKAFNSLSSVPYPEERSDRIALAEQAARNHPRQVAAERLAIFPSDLRERSRILYDQDVRFISRMKQVRLITTDLTA